jgi:hypothetical protein
LVVKFILLQNCLGAVGFYFHESGIEDILDIRGVCQPGIAKK